VAGVPGAYIFGTCVFYASLLLACALTVIVVGRSSTIAWPRHLTNGPYRGRSGRTTLGKAEAEETLGRTRHIVARVRQ
jgi:hypothetical protein